MPVKSKGGPQDLRPYSAKTDFVTQLNSNMDELELLALENQKAYAMSLKSIKKSFADKADLINKFITKEKEKTKTLGVEYYKDSSLASPP